jgi:23S rRNA maturation-related 3'-5' exoribonuclease YhaM
LIDKLLAEINKIQDTQIKVFTLEVFKLIPEASWRMNSSRDHHLKDERGEWGNALHTLRVVSICDKLCDLLNYIQLHKDILKSAAILHDSCKHGINAEVPFIYKEHPQLVKEVINKTTTFCPYRQMIIDIIGRHMGRWGNVPYDWSDNRNITLSFLLHTADCIEAKIDTLLDIK